MTRTQISLLTIGLIILVVGIFYFSKTPSNDRDWAIDQQILPYAIFADNTVEIKNIRNFSYTTTKKYTPNYYNRHFDLDELVSVDYIVEPFAGIGAAHTFLSFGFTNGDYVSISVEIRKEVGETFSPLKGLAREYELMYVIADENDVIKLRTNFRKDTVYLYPVNTTPDKMRILFVDMLTRANKLKEVPEFYNTLTSTCTTNISSHINKITPNTIPWDIRLLLPKNSDVLAYELGLIDNSLPLEETRLLHQINTKAAKYANDPNFSKQIREIE